MKTRTSDYVEVSGNQGTECCGAASPSVEKADPCCEQPADDSSCCDKSEAKEVNAERTECC